MNANETVEIERNVSSVIRRNVSSFRTMDWQPYFDSLNNGAILVDIDSRALHFWEQNGAYHLYPCSVPLTEDLTRRGRTRVVLKDPEPDWRPTPSMKERNPEWPDYVGPGPDNPQLHSQVCMRSSCVRIDRYLSRSAARRDRPRNAGTCTC